MRFDPHNSETEIVEIPAMTINNRAEFDTIMAKLNRQVNLIWPKPKISRQRRKPEVAASPIAIHKAPARK
jgi:hypothetical protein